MDKWRIDCGLFIHQNITQQLKYIYKKIKNISLDKGYLWGKKEGSGFGVGYKWIFICIYYVLSITLKRREKHETRQKS